MGLDPCSDYGSGSSLNSWSPPQPPARNPKCSSYLDLVMRRCTLEDVMTEFRMNGYDSPYNPDDDKAWSRQAVSSELSGLGPASAYLRQRSWPAAERAPAPRQRPRSLHDFATSTPLFDEPAPAPFTPDTPEPFSVRGPPSLSNAPSHTNAPAVASASLTPSQARVLSSLPDRVLYSLLRELHHERRSKIPQECRFCKNNGERESYYRSHSLKDGAGRVSCPVLRDFVCKRCGAHGDTAHTIKYCPLSTSEERIKSAAMMRSVRMSSGRRRAGGDKAWGEPAAFRDTGALYDAPLDPQWAALEQKLLL